MCSYGGCVFKRQNSYKNESEYDFLEDEIEKKICLRCYPWKSLICRQKVICRLRLQFFGHLVSSGARSSFIKRTCEVKLYRIYRSSCKQVCGKLKVVSGGLREFVMV